jgi:hypothetical protein
MSILQVTFTGVTISASSASFIIFEHDEASAIAANAAM